MSGIGIVNAFGTNRGDEAMLSALLLILRRHDPGVKVTVYANSWLDLERHGAAVRPWITPRDVWPRLPGTLARQLFARGWLNCPSTAPPALRSIAAHSFVISGPAGPYFGDIKLSREPSCLLPLAVCDALDVPFGIVAVSAGPFHNRRRNRLRRKILEKARFWTLRETISARHAEALGLAGRRDVGTDLVFAHPDRTPDEFLDACQREEYDGVVDQLRRHPGILVTLNMTSHVPLDAAKTRFDLHAYVDAITLLLTHVAARTDHVLWLVPHFYGAPHEQEMLLRIARGVSAAQGRQRRGGIRIVPPYLNAEAQMSLYRHAAFAISHRYHPTIFAARAALPFLCIRHQFKVDGMLQAFGDPGPVCKTDDTVEQWRTAFDVAWQDRDTIGSMLKDRLPGVLEQSLVHERAMLAGMPGGRGGTGAVRPGGGR